MGSSQKIFYLRGTLFVLPMALLSYFVLDLPLAEYFSQSGEDPWKAGARWVTLGGLADPYFFISLFFWGLSIFKLRKGSPLLSNSKRLFWKELGKLNFLFFKGLLLSGFLVHLLKSSIGRQRPHYQSILDHTLFEPFQLNWQWQSMPSGHTQVIFTAAMFFSQFFPKLRALWFFLAVVIGFTRVILLDHFLSDVIVGAWVGMVGAHIVLQRQHKLSLEKERHP